MRFCRMMVFIACLLSACVSHVLACECTITSVAKLKQISRVVFVGTVIKVSENGKARFAITELWKGDNVREVTIYTNAGMCSAWFEQGKTYLVFAYWEADKKRLETNACMRTAFIEERAEELKKLGAPKIIRMPKAVSK